MKMLYISGPQSLDIKPEGLSRSIGVKFAVGIRKAHALIYRNIRDLLGENMEFAGLFTRQDLLGFHWQAL